MIERGYYYHFKHDPKKGLNDRAYVILGTALQTETNEPLVVYKPLYDPKDGLLDGYDFCARPLKMFKELVQKDGQAVPRFIKITDKKIISELKKLLSQNE